MAQYDVDFNMSAFSTVGDMFADPEFSAPSNSLLWELGALEDSNRERTGFLIMPKHPYEWYMDAHGCLFFNNADLACGPRDTTAHFPVFLHLRTSNFPCPDSITRSEQAQQRLLEREAAKHSHDLLVPSSRENNPLLSFLRLTAWVCARYWFGVVETGEDDLAQQDHMSAHVLTPSAVASEF